jgi:hypothetical protein
MGSWVDSLRLLHTREIERIALAATLWIRAALVLMMPASGFLSIVGVVPFGPGSSPVRDVGWVVGATWALAVAMASPAIVASVIDRETESARKTLLRSESALGASTILAVPSWLAFSFFAGPVNWLMRPGWRPHRTRLLLAAVMVWVTLFVAALVLAGRADTPQLLLAEVLAALSCLALISNSFGLLLPLVLGYALFVLPAWHVRAGHLQRHQWRERTAPVITALASAIDAAQAERRDSAAVREVEPQLRRAKARLESLMAIPHGRTQLFRRRTLEQVVRAGLRRAAEDHVHPIRCATPDFAPHHLAATQLQSWRVANHLEVALARIASEAVRHGEFELRCRCSCADECEVVWVTVENDIALEHADASATPAAPGRGAREIESAVEQLPDGHLRQRGFTRGATGLPVFVVEFSFSAGSLATERR